MPVWFNTNLVGVARERDNLMNRCRRAGRKIKNLYVKAVEKRHEFNFLVKIAKKKFCC